MQLSPGKSKQCDEDVTGLPIETKKCQIEMPNWSAKLDCQIGTKMLNWNAKLNCQLELPNWTVKVNCQIDTKMLNWNAKLNYDVNDDCQNLPIETRWSEKKPNC